MGLFSRSKKKKGRKADSGPTVDRFREEVRTALYKAGMGDGEIDKIELHVLVTTDVHTGFAQLRDLGNDAYRMEIHPHHRDARHIRGHEAARVAIARARKRGWKVFGGRRNYPAYIQPPGGKPIATKHFGLIDWHP